MAEHECRFCGAELPRPDEDGRMECSSCGRHTSVESPAAEAPPSITVVVDAGAGISRSRHRWMFVIPVAILIITVVSAMRISGRVSRAVGNATASVPTPSIGSGPHVIDAVVPVTADASSDQDLVVLAVVQTSDASGIRRQIRALEPTPDGGFRTRWNGPDLGSNAVRIEAVTVDDVVYVSAGETIFALDADDGTERWRDGLPDRPATACAHRCLVLVDGGVAVQTADGAVSTHGPDAPEARHRFRLEDTSATVLAREGRLLLLDIVDGRAVVDTVHPDTGEIINRFEPRCEDDEAAILGTFRVFGIPGSDDLVVLGGFHDQCAARFRPTESAPRWRTELTRIRWQPDAPVAIDPERLVYGGGDDGDAVRLDLDSGTEVLLDGDGDRTVAPLVLDDGLLVSATTTTRGTPRGGFQTWDLSRAEGVLDVTIEPRMTWYDRSSTASGVVLFEGESIGLLEGDRRGLRLIRFTNERDGGAVPSVSVQTIDPMTGEQGPIDVHPLPDGRGSRRIEVLDVSDLLVFVDDGELVWIDATT